MLPKLAALGIDRMSVEERIALVNAIWDSIAADSHPPLLTETQCSELTRRLEDLEANPEDVVPWHQVQNEARARLQQ